MRRAALSLSAAAPIAALLAACTTSVHGNPALTSPSPASPTTSASTPSSPSSPSLPSSTPPTASASVHQSTASALPLGFATGTATRVITVVAPSAASTTATLRAWQKSGTSWTQIGDGVTAHLGTAGLSAHPSESSTATPIGSFTLTSAFGRQPNPGTSLAYHETSPSDWWISQPGPLYNTMQACSASCPFAKGAPNEHLFYAVPYYRYAVVIDYNTANSPTGVRQGAGSAFFLHVTVGQPTQGCISIPEPRLVALLRWLTPTAQPRILIGIG